MKKGTQNIFKEAVKGHNIWKRQKIRENANRTDQKN